ncbi:uncharacterized protein LOC118738502 [Rhagoletis pomonella]|uniref:uncharacterized protein LOC118738502 n=1 Tax=Rhagoletis pomonella TaxID=28610 RepID=UPI0017838AAB|nr:uncharacterized protein LOC118738502 [Rhagoletis pomonella]
MASLKLLLALSMFATFSISVNAGPLDYIYPANPAIKLEEPNDSEREEIGVGMNPDTPEEQLAKMDMHTMHDEKSTTERVTMYTADQDGYTPRYMFKNRKLGEKLLMSTVG